MALSKGAIYVIAKGEGSPRLRNVFIFTVLFHIRLRPIEQMRPLKLLPVHPACIFNFCIYVHGNLAASCPAKY